VTAEATTGYFLVKNLIGRYADVRDVTRLHMPPVEGSLPSRPAGTAAGPSHPSEMHAQRHGKTTLLEKVFQILHEVRKEAAGIPVQA
jgi:hypothetical protein